MSSCYADIRADLIAGYISNGQRVVAYGLFVEHFEGYETVWTGNDGRVYFYQSEIPYDVPDQTRWGPKGYASYKVSDQVTSHSAQGLGVYCNFWRSNVQLENAIEAPTGSGHQDVRMEYMCTVWLDGADGSSINHVFNGQGQAATKAKAGKPQPFTNL